MARLNAPVVFVAILILASICWGQVAGGSPVFGSLAGGTFDTVNLGNLNVHFSIPVLHKAGRGLPFTYDLNYDSSVWYPAAVSGSQVWTPQANWGWRGITDAAVGTVGGSSQRVGCDPGLGTIYHYFIYRDQAGTDHKIPTGDYNTCNIPDPTTFFASDGSGYSLTITTGLNFSASSKLYNRDGSIINTGANTITDRNGNYFSATVSGSTTFTDTLGATVLTVSGSGTPSSPVQYMYASPSNPSVPVTTHYTNYTVKTNFGCSGISEYGPVSNPLVSDVALPDGSKYLFTYEPTPGDSTKTTGRLQQITLPTGGTITYTYTGGNNGIVCTDGSAAGLTRQLNPGGTWTYSRTGSGNSWTTTVADPSSPANETVINFSKDANTTNPTSNFYETQRQVYQGSHTSGTLLMTTYNCWNNNFTNCPTQSVSSPVSQLDAYRQPPGVSAALSETKYDNNGRVTEDKKYDFGSVLVSDTSISYASLGNILDKPSLAVVKDSSNNVVAQTTYTYDEGSVATTSGTPQHTSVSGSRGNLTTLATQVNATQTLYRHFAYYDTGTLNTSTDVSLSSTANGSTTAYVYGSGTSCGNSFPTQINLPLSLSRSMTWNCTGGVQLTATDENSKTVTTTYNDPYFWRPASATDQLNNTANITYVSATTTEGAFPFNSNLSTIDGRSKIDGLGRPIIGQRKQGPSATTYDSVETDYDVAGRVSKSTQPYSASADSLCSGTCPGTTYAYDALNRPATVTDAGGGTVSFSYTKNDVLQTVGPAPAGENTKRKQLEYDGLGRLTSVCEVSAGSGSGACSQANSLTGYWTKYAYNVPPNVNSLTVTQNAQSGSSQTRTYIYDMLGRPTSETNPETGTTAYVYDTVPSSCYNYGDNQSGNLVAKTDANGNTTCYHYDVLHRLADIGTSGPNAPGCKRFRYDSASNGVDGSAPSGVTVNNVLGRLVEAETDNCGAWPPTPITDEWFSYSARGELTDVYESTPHSGGYYHTTTSYFENGAVKTLGGIPGQTSFTYGIDSEGRPKTAVQGSTNLVSNTTFNTASQPLVVTLGLGDSDTYVYDPNTGRMSSYTFTLGSTPTSIVGNLTWNPNGTLSKLAITDGFNAGGTQTCKYGDPSSSVPGYDDLGRLIKVDCSASVWQQNFSYDPFGNLTKTVPTGGTGIAWNPGYNAANNRYTLTGTSYDANGNLLTDTFHTYTWDTEGHPVTIDSSACGTNGICATYDALGRIVEKNVAGTYTQFLYSPVGKLGLMNGQTLVNAYIPLPGGEIFNIAPGYARFWHRDWLGTMRLSSMRNNRTMDYDRAFAPFGEGYKNFGSTGNNSFTGHTQDTIAGTYDTAYRELNPSQGRWLSPDPSGIGAADTGTPQSWNRYAYVMNSPLNAVDVLGLDICMDNNCPGTAYGGAGGDGGYLYNSAQFAAGDMLMDGQAAPGWLSQAALNSGAGVMCSQCQRGDIVGANNTIYRWGQIPQQSWTSPTTDGSVAYRILGEWGWIASGTADDAANNGPDQLKNVALGYSALEHKISRFAVAGGLIVSGVAVGVANVGGWVAACTFGGPLACGGYAVAVAPVVMWGSLMLIGSGINYYQCEDPSISNDALPLGGRCR